MFLFYLDKFDLYNIFRSFLWFHKVNFSIFGFNSVYLLVTFPAYRFIQKSYHLFFLFSKIYFDVKNLIYFLNYLWWNLIKWIKEIIIVCNILNIKACFHLFQVNKKCTAHNLLELFSILFLFQLKIGVEARNTLYRFFNLSAGAISGKIMLITNF